MQRRKSINKRLLLAILLGGIATFGSVIFLIIANVGQANICTRLEKHGFTTTAKVNAIRFYTKPFVSRIERQVNTLEEANNMILDLQFSTQKGVMHQSVSVRYTQQADLQAAYDEARTGSLRVRYDPSDPQKVRLESEFITVDDHLCQQQLLE